MALPGFDITRWYAVRSRWRHEKVVAHQLESQGINVFLPLLLELRKWSDRHKQIETALFLFPGDTLCGLHTRPATGCGFFKPTA